MKVAYLAAGAGGMFCGSCLRDNRVAATLIRRGRDVTLIPLYTPLRTDEPCVSRARVLYGGLNVYLQQMLPFFRRAPGWLDRLLDARFVLDRLSRFAGATRPESLGAMTVAVLRGEHGPQRKELDKLVAYLQDLRPDLVNLPNLMFLGAAPRLRQALGVPIVCTLSGEDVFLDRLPEPYRAEAFDLIRRHAREVDAFISASGYFADHAARHFDLPRERIHAVRMGIRVDSDLPPAAPPREPFAIGYLARVCPEKGLAVLADAFIELRRSGRDCVLRAAGYLGAADRAYLDEIRARLTAAGVGDVFDYAGEVGLDEKRRFLRSLHVLSVPTVYREAKGFYVLEALAAGVPVVQPRHGSFPELIEATGGGLLYDPADPAALSDALARMMDDADLRARLAAQGRNAVQTQYTDEIMADQTWAVYERCIEGR